MKTSRRSILFTKFMVMLLLFSIIGFWGCEKDTIFENQYPEFLVLDSYELSEMSEKDMNTVGQALQRLDIYKKDGLYHIKQTSGVQINISDDLFKLIKGLFDNTNDIKLKNSRLGYSGKRLKSAANEGGDGTPSDCMAHSISYAGGGSYGDVGSWLISQYGLGVPLSEFYNACHHFLPYGDTVSIGAIPDGEMNNEIIIYLVNDTTAHAVNGVYYDESSGFIWVYDKQSSTSSIIDTTEIYNIYQS